ncbi:MAG: CsbD family protein [bacterium]
MNSDQLAGRWKQMRGAIKKQWGNLTDDELDKAGGNYDMLIGKIQERYGDSREAIERKLDEISRHAA